MNNAKRETVLAKQLTRINLKHRRTGRIFCFWRGLQNWQVVSLTRTKEAGASSWRLRQAVEILHYDESFSRVSSPHTLPPLRSLSCVYILSTPFSFCPLCELSLEGVCITCVRFYSATLEVALEGRIGTKIESYCNRCGEMSKSY